jgi:hypothetical protein
MFTGHSTKGEHNIHKVNEYMKNISFYFSNVHRAQYEG